MIPTVGPTLDENLKKVTPWWDIVTQYLIAAMMAIALTSIAVQVTKDNLICIPALNCTSILAKRNGSLAVNVSDDDTKLCQSLPKHSKKKVLAKMVDRRFYDYVDSVCFQELSGFTKFFPLILLGEAVVLLALDIVWTKLPFSFAILNHFVLLTDEGYSSLATIDIILGGGLLKQMNEGTDLPIKPIIPEADALKVLNLIEKAHKFKEKYESKPGCKISLHLFYKMRIIFQFLACCISIGVNIWGFQNFNTVHFKCVIDEIVFTKEYEHFECSHPFAPYLKVALILFMISLSFHLLTSFIALYETLSNGTSFTFKKDQSNSESSSTGNDFAFLFCLLSKHDGLYAERVSYFFRTGTYDNLPGNILRYMKTHSKNPSSSQEVSTTSIAGSSSRGSN